MIPVSPLVTQRTGTARSKKISITINKMYDGDHFAQDMWDSVGKLLTGSPGGAALQKLQIQKSMKVLESVNMTPHSKADVNCTCWKALLVDDEPMNIFAVKNVLRSTNFNISEAFDGQQAINIVNEHIETKKCGEKCCVFNFILMDYNMPNINGPNATKKIIEIYREAGLVKPVVIAFTAYVEDEYMDECMAAGMSGFLTKPLKKALLFNKLREMKILE
jgi:CheY-like chemotaxis protein